MITKCFLKVAYDKAHWMSKSCPWRLKTWYNGLTISDVYYPPFHWTLTQVKKWKPLRHSACNEMEAMYIWEEENTLKLNIVQNDVKCFKMLVPYDENL